MLLVSQSKAIAAVTRQGDDLPIMRRRTASSGQTSPLIAPARMMPDRTRRAARRAQRRRVAAMTSNCVGRMRLRLSVADDPPTRRPATSAGCAPPSPARPEGRMSQIIGEDTGDQEFGQRIALPTRRRTTAADTPGWPATPPAATPAPANLRSSGRAGAAVKTAVRLPWSGRSALISLNVIRQGGRHGDQCTAPCHGKDRRS
jgi:hypothetical protein